MDEERQLTVQRMNKIIEREFVSLADVWSKILNFFALDSNFNLISQMSLVFYPYSTCLIRRYHTHS